MWEHAEESIHLQPIDWMSESSDLLGRIAMRTQTVLGASHTEGNLLKVLSTQHEKVLNRHRQLPWKLHTLEHHFDVHGRLSYLLSHLKDPVSINDRMKILMLEAAFRHDDGHVGKKYRQEVIKWDSKSNEEYALLLLRKDFRGASKRVKASPG